MKNEELKNVFACLKTMLTHVGGWVDELATGLSYRQILRAQALWENQIGRSFQPDLSKGGYPRVVRGLSLVRLC